MNRIIFFVTTILYFSSVSTLYSQENLLLKFASGKSALNTESRLELDSFINHLPYNIKDYSWEVFGHADSTGKLALNQTLSDNRSTTIVDYLVEKGVNASKITYKGLAYTTPIATNTTKEGRELNRRVEIFAVDKFAKYNYDLEAHNFNFNVAEGGEFTTPNGTIVTIEPNSLTDYYYKPVDGEVEIKITEYNDPIDFIAGDIPMSAVIDTVTAYLNSGGMFRIEAFKDGKRLKLDTLATIKITHPLDKSKPYSFFKLNQKPYQQADYFVNKKKTANQPTKRVNRDSIAIVDNEITNQAGNHNDNKLQLTDNNSDNQQRTDTLRRTGNTTTTTTTTLLTNENVVSESYKIDMSRFYGKNRSISKNKNLDKTPVKRDRNRQRDADYQKEKKSLKKNPDYKKRKISKKYNLKQYKKKTLFENLKAEKQLKRNYESKFESPDEKKQRKWLKLPEINLKKGKENFTNLLHRKDLLYLTPPEPEIEIPDSVHIRSIKPYNDICLQLRLCECLQQAIEEALKLASTPPYMPLFDINYHSFKETFDNTPIPYTGLNVDSEVKNIRLISKSNLFGKKYFYINHTYKKHPELEPTLYVKWFLPEDAVVDSSAFKLYWSDMRMSYSQQDGLFTMRLKNSSKQISFKAYPQYNNALQREGSDSLLNMKLINHYQTVIHNREIAYNNTQKAKAFQKLEHYVYMWEYSKLFMTDLEMRMSYIEWLAYFDANRKMMQKRYDSLHRSWNRVRAKHCIFVEELPIWDLIPKTLLNDSASNDQVINELGTYNFDIIEYLQYADKIKPVFINEKGDAVDAKRVFLIIKDINTVIEQKAELVSLYTGQRNTLLIFDRRGYRYYCPEEELQKLKIPSNGNCTIKLKNISPYSTNLKELKKILGF